MTRSVSSEHHADNSEHLGESLVTLRVNGQRRHAAVASSLLLVDFLRDQLGLIGTKTGCDGGECGACTVLLNGRPVLACLILAVRCQGAEIETVEGLSQGGRLSVVQRAFHQALGSQCGFCTPGMIMATEALLRHTPDPSEDDIRQALSANICRCTGYVKIIEAVQQAAQQRRAGQL